MSKMVSIAREAKHSFSSHNKLYYERIQLEIYRPCRQYIRWLCVLCFMSLPSVVVNVVRIKENFNQVMVWIDDNFYICKASSAPHVCICARS